MKKLIFAAVLLICHFNLFAQQPTANSSFKQEFLDRINFVRAQGCNCGTQYMPPVAPLVWNDKLQLSALGHAVDMDNYNYFSHTSQDGRTMQDRIMAAGYNYNGFRSYMIGENIAFGQHSIAEVMNGWFKSPGHCKNLMNGSFKEIGVAKSNLYWVQDFGGRESFTPQQQRLIKSGRMVLRDAE